MKVMRLASGRGKSHFDVKSLMEPFMSNMEYTLSLYDEDFNTSVPQFDINTMIPWCELQTGSEVTRSFDKKKSFKCNLFDPVVTESNVCHSFNPITALDFLRPSTFTESFKEAYDQDFNQNRTEYKAEGAGEEHALNFYLMNLDFRREAQQGNKSPPFSVGISNKRDYLDMKSIGQATKPGYHTIRKVQAMEIVPSEDLHDVPINKRKCMFPDENQALKIFSQYSQSACELECRIEKAAQTCQCYPWFMPRPRDTEHQTICSVYGNYCFQKVLTRNEVLKNCKCWPTCHQLEFTYNEQLNKLDAEELCQEHNEHTSKLALKSVESRIADKLMENGYNSLYYKYFTVKEWLDSGSNETMEPWNYKQNRIRLCQHLVKNHLAKVSVMFDRKKYVRTMTNLKVTFADKLSTFGKMFLLFQLIQFSIKWFDFRRDSGTFYWNEFA